MSPTSHQGNEPSGMVSTDSIKQVTIVFNNSEILQISCAPASLNSSSWKGDDVWIICKLRDRIVVSWIEHGQRPAGECYNSFYKVMAFFFFFQQFNYHPPFVSVDMQLFLYITSF